MLQAELKVIGGKQGGKVIPLTTQKFLIGREQDCHLRPNSELVSRHHCVFTQDDFGLRLRDLGSTNGTFVNGERLRGQVMLQTGDRVHIGKLDFEVVVQEPAPAEPEPSVDPLPVPETAGESQDAAASTETMELSAVETSYDIPVTQPGEDAGEGSGVYSGDTTIITQQPPEASEQPVAPEPPAAQIPQPPAPAYPQPPAPVYPQPPAPVYPQPPAVAYPQPPVPYPPQPVPYQPMPGVYPPQAYPPQPLYPQQPVAYPQQPIALPQPPEAVPEQAASQEEGEGEGDGAVSVLPVRLPPPETTGAAPPEPPAPEDAAPPAEKPSDEDDPAHKAADIIKQYMHRRPEV